MRCDEVRKTFPLFLYGELSFDEEERVELHIDECGGCREALEREKIFFRSLNRAEMTPSQDLLAECRSGLRARLAGTQPRQTGIWEKIRQGFTIHLHFAPGIAQVAGAVAMLALGFVGARMVPGTLGGGWSAASVFNPATSHVRYVEPTSAGKIQIVVEETRERTLSGSVDDRDIQRLLLVAAKDPADAGLRVESVDLLKNRPQSAEIRSALLYAVQHDPNAGVRLKALDGLKNFADDSDTRKALTQVLLTDDNPGVRTQVIDLLSPHPSDAMLGALQELMLKEDNDYIRTRVQRVLHEMNASVDTY